MNPIIGSDNKPVKIITRNIRESFENRGEPLTSAPGMTMMSKFAGTGGSKELLKFRKLAADVETANPAIRSPLLNQSNFYMPESDSSTGEPNRLLNQWIYYYLKWNSLVGNLCSLHAELPLSRFALRGIEDPTILNFYEEMVESMELHLKSVELLRQFFSFGEVIPFTFWSDEYNCFTDMTFLDPNYVYVKGHYLLHSDVGDDVEFYELEPDPMLTSIVKNDDYVTTLLREHLDEGFIQAVRQNKRLLLSNFCTHMIKHRLKWSDLRGTALLLRCLKQLLYKDKLLESQYVIADAHVNPKWIWKLGQAGDLATGGYMPSEDDLEAFRDLLVEANNDPLFTIITHYAVNVEAVGLAGKLLPLKQEYDQIENEILTAFFANKAVTTGQGPSFATASVAFRTLMSRYIPIRAKVERYYYQKLFAPTAYANKFFKRKKVDLDQKTRTGNEETNKLIIPQIDWRSKANLLDDGSIKSIISSMVNSGRMPMKILTEALDIDYDEVRNYLFSEQATVFDPIAQGVRKAVASKVTDEDFMGQPYLPKTNQPVSIKAQTGQGVVPTAKKASIKKKKTLSDKLLTIKPLDQAVPKDPIQTQIDKGKPERGGNPEIPDPFAESLKLEDPMEEKEIKGRKKNLKKKETTRKPRVFDVLGDAQNRLMLKKSVIAKKYKARRLSLKKSLVSKPKDEKNKK